MYFCRFLVRSRYFDLNLSVTATNFIDLKIRKFVWILSYKGLKHHFDKKTILNLPVIRNAWYCGDKILSTNCKLHVSFLSALNYDNFYLLSNLSPHR